MDTPIEALDLSARLNSLLRRMGITTVGEVLEMLEMLGRHPVSMRKIRNFGEKSQAELVAILKRKGYLPPEYEIPE